MMYKGGLKTVSWGNLEMEIYYEKLIMACISGKHEEKKNSQGLYRDVYIFKDCVVKLDKRDTGHCMIEDHLFSSQNYPTGEDSLLLPILARKVYVHSDYEIEFKAIALPYAPTIPTEEEIISNFKGKLHTLSEQYDDLDPNMCDRYIYLSDLNLKESCLKNHRKEACVGDLRTENFCIYKDTIVIRDYGMIYDYPEEMTGY